MNVYTWVPLWMYIHALRIGTKRGLKKENNITKENEGHDNNKRVGGWQDNRNHASKSSNNKETCITGI